MITLPFGREQFHILPCSLLGQNSLSSRTRTPCFFSSNLLLQRCFIFLSSLVSRLFPSLDLFIFLCKLRVTAGAPGYCGIHPEKTEPLAALVLSFLFSQPPRFKGGRIREWMAFLIFASTSPSYASWSSSSLFFVLRLLRVPAVFDNRVVRMQMRWIGAEDG